MRQVGTTYVAFNRQLKNNLSIRDQLITSIYVLQDVIRKHSLIMPGEKIKFMPIALIYECQLLWIDWFNFCATGTGTSSSMSPDLTVGNQQRQQERQPSPIHQQTLSPVQPLDVTPPPSPCCAPDGTRTTSMSQGRDGSLAFKGTPSVLATEPLTSAQPEISSRQDAVCATENEPTKQRLAPAKNLHEAEDDSISSNQDGQVIRAMSPASFQSQDELSGIPDQATAPKTASSEPFSFVMPVYRGAMEYTSSGEVSPVDSMDAIYWDDLGDPVGMTPMPRKAVDTVLQLDESITLSLADDIGRGLDEAAAAAPPCESANVYRPLVSDIPRQSKQGESVRWRESISKPSLSTRSYPVRNCHKRNHPYY